MAAKLLTSGTSATETTTYTTASIDPVPGNLLLIAVVNESLETDEHMGIDVYWNGERVPGYLQTSVEEGLSAMTTYLIVVPSTAQAGPITITYGYPQYAVLWGVYEIPTDGQSTPVQVGSQQGTSDEDATVGLFVGEPYDNSTNFVVNGYIRFPGTPVTSFDHPDSGRLNHAESIIKDWTLALNVYEIEPASEHQIVFNPGGEFNRRSAHLFNIDLPYNRASGTTLQHWNGSAFEAGTLRRFDGTTWVPAIAKRWDGSDWIDA